MPGPDLVNPVGPPLSAITEDIVKSETLFWMTTRSAPLAPLIVPPVIVPAAVNAELTRMPPEVITLVPLSVIRLPEIVLAN